MSEHRPTTRFEDGSPPVCVVDDETWPCSASNVSEGLRCPCRDYNPLNGVNGQCVCGHDDALHDGDVCRAALAHAAPEGPCAICKRPFDHKTHQSGIFYHHPFSQPDATEEAGRTVEQRNARGALAADDFEGER